MYDLILEKKKSKTDKEYVYLGIDFGFKKQAITFKTAEICTLLLISEKELYDICQELAVDTCLNVGSYDLQIK